MFVQSSKKITRRVVGNNVWLSTEKRNIADLPAQKLNYEVLETEEAVGQAMFEELLEIAESKEGDIVAIIVGGRGGQALHRLLGKKAKTDEIDHLLARLRIFTQDALAPLAMNNSLSFVRDFERLLGKDFFSKVKRFTSMQTETTEPETKLTEYLELLESLGGVDIFFLGLGPEAHSASHLCYIKPNSGAILNDAAGIIPISESILEHHISKFKAGGSVISEADEAECRSATHILTLGPAVILSAKRIVQSIVDAGTAPAKRKCYQRLLETEIASDEAERATQFDENPGLWLLLHPNVRSLVLPDVLAD